MSIKSFVYIISVCCLVVWTPTQALADKSSGLPIPRFVSLKSSEVNLRTGPGIRYPIRWVYRKKWLPMEVTDEFEHWRQVRDITGESGWVHKSLLSGRRTAIIYHDIITLYRRPDSASSPVLRAENGVVADIVECDATWCRLQLDNLKGWTPKQTLWGVYDDEVID